MPTCENARRIVLKKTRSPGTQLVAADARQSGPVRLLVGTARQHQADAVLEHVAREAAAVETLLGAGCRRGGSARR
jgi:hypothetical protein